MRGNDSRTKIWERFAPLSHQMPASPHFASRASRLNSLVASLRVEVDEPSSSCSKAPASALKPALVTPKQGKKQKRSRRVHAVSWGPAVEYVIEVRVGWGSMVPPSPCSFAFSPPFNEPSLASAHHSLRSSLSHANADRE